MPLAIAILLAVIGLCIAFFDRDDTGDAWAAQIRWQLRALVSVLAAIAVFALTADRLGLIPTSALSAFAASRAMRDVRLTARLILAAVIAVICIAIFHFGLRLPLSLAGA